MKFALGVLIALHLYALVLRVMPVPGTPLMVQRIAQGESVRRSAVPLEEISPHVIRAVIASEDSGFCKHNGVDGAAIETAWEEYRAGKGLRGASTITQQTAKNVFLWNGGGIVRKAGDAWMGVFVDGFWGKRRVMEVYLNNIEWGDGLFGVEAAAQTRFGKSAKDLTEREAALLATVLPNPHKWRLDPPGPYVSKRGGTVQARMRNVRRDALDACVWGEEGPPDNNSTPPKKQTPTPKPEILPEDTPDYPPEAGGVAEALTPEEPAPIIEEPSPNAFPAPNEEAADALDAVLNSVDEVLTESPDPAVGQDE